VPEAEVELFQNEATTSVELLTTVANWVDVT
jgi:hypothetical protein